MRFSIIALVFAATTAFAQEDDAPATTSAVISNIGKLPSQLSQLAALLPTLPPNWELPESVRNLKNSLPTPPPGILKDIVSGVPDDVLRGLVNPASRSALQQSVADGDSPQWYQDLPTPVKEYFALFATQIAEKSLTYKPNAAVATPGSTVEASTGDGDDEEGDGGESWDLGEQDDGDNAAAGGFGGRAMSTSAFVAVGILGAALIL
ncbi:hypothetical protein BJY04DRAFT_214215 [Aspergillus karnatakaensis]|uniref:uncharacterized protein n=1 Tax=Aspergillus karnatakaensis TaxID=1810916 RepID=UPI003CCD74C1